MKKCTRLVVTVLCLCAIIGSSTSVLAFDQGAAQRYADTYVFNYNGSYRNWSPNDCTNFVSQCLNYGGMKQNSRWQYAYSGAPRSWYNADDLKNYLKNYQGAEYVGRWKYTAGYNSGGAYYYSYVGVKNSANIQGLGSEVIFYDWQGDGTMDHASIVVGTNYAFKGDYGEYGTLDYTKGYGDLIDQHNHNRRHQIWHLYNFNPDRKWTEIYCFRVKG